MQGEVWGMMNRETEQISAMPKAEGSFERKEKNVYPGGNGLPRVTAAWLRYFARMIDETIYLLLWESFLSLVLHTNIMEMGAAGIGAGIAARICILLLAEPVLLARLGTTPGKFLMGLRAAAENGARLTWREAFYRTWTVLKKGSGFYIPMYCLVREYLSYRACKKGEILEWEEEAILVWDGRPVQRKVAAAIVILAGLTAGSLVIWQAGAVPVHRGNITAAQYVENFNGAQDFWHIDRQLNLPELYPPLGQDSPMALTADGDWEKLPARSYVIQTAEDYAPLPRFHFTEENGVMTGLEFSQSYSNENVEIVSPGDLMAVTVLSYICAQEEYRLFPRFPSMLYQELKVNGDRFQSFTMSLGGVTVDCVMEYEGYQLRRARYSDTPALVPVYGEHPSLRMEFRMQRVHS